MHVLALISGLAATATAVLLTAGLSSGVSGKGSTSPPRLTIGYGACGADALYEYRLEPQDPKAIQYLLSSGEYERRGVINWDAGFVGFTRELLGAAAEEAAAADAGTPAPSGGCKFLKIALITDVAESSFTIRGTDQALADFIGRSPTLRRTLGAVSSGQAKMYRICTVNGSKGVAEGSPTTPAPESRESIE